MFLTLFVPSDYLLLLLYYLTHEESHSMLPAKCILRLLALPRL